MQKKIDFNKLRRLSADIRIATVRTIGEAGFGHIGGSVSIADVLAVLYGEVMKVDPQKPDWEERDWLILSKGHCGPGLYAALALKGYFPMEWLKTLNKPGTNLPSHADHLHTPGVDKSTGSLGQGFSSAVGVALGNRVQGRDSYTYCIIGDGEMQEGEVWEAAETANHLKLDHLVVFVDWNKKQLDGRLEDICEPLDIEAKFRAFGFETQLVKGYDVEAVYHAIEKAKQVKGKPHLIVLDTIKGIGIHFAEEAEFNHYMTFDSRKAEEAVEEIERRCAANTYPLGEIQ